MKLGSSEDMKKIAAVAAFVVIASGIVYFEYFDTGSPATPAAPPTAVETTAPAVVNGPPEESAAAPAAAVGKPAKMVGTAASSLDPTLHMDAMLVSEQVVYAGNGRNIFSPNSAPRPVVIPKAVAPARNVAVNTAPPPPPGPPPPPPIDLKFFGFVSANGKNQAFLLHNDDVYLASAGDVVLRRYRVIAIDAKTIQVEDMQNNNRQTLPLLMN